MYLQVLQYSPPIIFPNNWGKVICKWKSGKKYSQKVTTKKKVNSECRGFPSKCLDEHRNPLLALFEINWKPRRCGLSCFFLLFVRLCWLQGSPAWLGKQVLAPWGFRCFCLCPLQNEVRGGIGHGFIVPNYLNLTPWSMSLNISKCLLSYSIPSRIEENGVIFF